MSGRLIRRYALLRCLRWLPIGLAVTSMVLAPLSRGLTLVEVGALLAVHSIVIIGLEIPAGALADALGRRPVLVLGTGLTGAGLGATALVTSVPAFAAAYATVAVGRALLSGALDAWFVDALDRAGASAALTRGLSLGSVGEWLGLTLGALAGGLLVQGWSAWSGRPPEYGIAALGSAGAALLACVAVITLVREPSRARARVTLVRYTRSILRQAVAEARGSVMVRVALIISAGTGAAYSAVELLWQPRVLERFDGLGPVELGLLAAMATGAAAVGSAWSPRLARRLDPRTAYVVACVVQGGVLACFAATDGVAFLVLYGAIYASTGFTRPLHERCLNGAVASGARATVLSAASLCGQLGALVTNVVAGALAGVYGVQVALHWVPVAFLVALVPALVLVARAGSTPDRPPRTEGEE